MNINGTDITSIVYVIIIVLTYAAEQFHIVPGGTTGVILALITGHAVGTTNAINGVPSISTKQTVTPTSATTVSNTTPDQG